MMGTSNVLVGVKRVWDGESQAIAGMEKITPESLTEPGLYDSEVGLNG